MQYPKIFDRARIEHDEYETTFKYVQCDRCRHMITEAGHEGCNREGYAVPFEGSIRKKCPDHQEK